MVTTSKTKHIVESFHIDITNEVENDEHIDAIINELSSAPFSGLHSIYHTYIDTLENLQPRFLPEDLEEGQIIVERDKDYTGKNLEIVFDNKGIYL